MFEEVCGTKASKMVIDTTNGERTDELLAATIGNVSLFAPLSKLEQRKLLSVMGRAKYRDGDYICTEGDVGHIMFIVLRGEVKVLKWTVS